MSTWQTLCKGTQLARNRIIVVLTARDDKRDVVKKQFGKLDVLVSIIKLIPLLQLSDLPKIVNISSSVVMFKDMIDEQLKGVLTSIPAEERLTLKAYTRIMANKYPEGVAMDINYNTDTITAEEGAGTPVKLALWPKGGPSGLFSAEGEPVSPEYSFHFPCSPLGPLQCCYND
ncbi:hypothetical protein V6N11_066108 [Hibiscus sabdariffa]|uniref:Uncharacterized protein n=1 Tax=Hibiscus sabdariffa TaxID=183260 RepID=A0ABR2NUZ3_9ROSI